jgi:hypothetical protein
MDIAIRTQNIPSLEVVSSGLGSSPGEVPSCGDPSGGNLPPIPEGF